MNPERIEQHGRDWEGLPLVAPIPIPASFDGEGSELYDLAELILERLELIGEFDPKYARDWAETVYAELRREEEAA